jgi:Na+/proline symporter
LLHEGGHLIGAVLAGSTVHSPKSLASGFLFSFDSRANTRGQFLGMTSGGWLATVLGLWIVYALLPSDLFASRVARGVVAANVLLVILIEVPLVVYSLLTGRVPPVENQPAPRAVANAAD